MLIFILSVHSHHAERGGGVETVSWKLFVRLCLLLNTNSDNVQ